MKDRKRSQRESEPENVEHPATALGLRPMLQGVSEHRHRSSDGLTGRGRTEGADPKAGRAPFGRDAEAGTSDCDTGRRPDAHETATWDGDLSLVPGPDFVIPAHTRHRDPIKGERNVGVLEGASANGGISCNGRLIIEPGAAVGPIDVRDGIFARPSTRVRADPPADSGILNVEEG